MFCLLRKTTSRRGLVDTSGKRGPKISFRGNQLPATKPQFQMCCDIHLYVEHSRPKDRSLKNLSREVVQRSLAMEDPTTKNALSEEWVPDDVISYVREPPEQKWSLVNPPGTEVRYFFFLFRRRSFLTPNDTFVRRKRTTSFCFIGYSLFQK
jgi:hypothetical protein